MLERAAAARISEIEENQQQQPRAETKEGHDETTVVDEQEEQGHHSAENCRALQAAEQALLQMQKRVSEAKALFEAARVHLRLAKTGAKEAVAEQAEAKTVLDEQSTLVDILLLRTTAADSDVVLEDELFARLHRQAMFNSATGKRFGAVLSLLQRAADAAASPDNNARSQLVNLRTRIEMEKERASVQVHRAEADVQSAVSVMTERQEQLDRLAVEEAMAEQQVSAAKLNAASSACYLA